MNKYQDALDRLKHINLDLILEKLGHEVADEVSDYGMCDYPNLEMSYDIDALQELVDRDTPKKVSYEGDGYDDKGDLIYDTAICPTCERKFEVDYDEHSNYCPSCGKRIEWGDEG